MNREALIAQLLVDEGLRLKPYRDTVGKLTIGVGHNLDDVGITQDEAMYLLANDVRRTYGELLEALPWVTKLDDARQNVLTNMAFNLGIKGLLGFKHALACMQREAWHDAADAMLQSKWARQVGARAVRLATVMRTGKL